MVGPKTNKVLALDIASGTITGVTPTKHFFFKGISFLSLKMYVGRTLLAATVHCSLNVMLHKDHSWLEPVVGIII